MGNAEGLLQGATNSIWVDDSTALNLGDEIVDTMGVRLGKSICEQIVPELNQSTANLSLPRGEFVLPVFNSYNNGVVYCGVPRNPFYDTTNTATEFGPGVILLRRGVAYTTEYTSSVGKLDSSMEHSYYPNVIYVPKFSYFIGRRRGVGRYADNTDEYVLHDPDSGNRTTMENGIKGCPIPDKYIVNQLPEDLRAELLAAEI